MGGFSDCRSLARTGEDFAALGVAEGRRLDGGLDPRVFAVALIRCAEN
jgi:hypothetical protein